LSVRLLIGDCRDRLRELEAGSVHACVTSPPFWRQRDYDHAGQLGIEREPSQFAAELVDIFREVRRVLVPDGSLWLELGDTYAAGGNGGGGSRAKKRRKLVSLQARTGWRAPPPGYKARDLSLTPFLVADGLRADGWYLRKTIIWDKGTATEPPRLDRPSVSHSYLFLLAPAGPSRVRNPGEDWFTSSVWTVRPNGLRDHPAPMEPELARRCIVSATSAGETVLDPFGGAGTTGVVADRLQRNAVLIELNPAYAAIARRRLEGDAGMFAAVEAA
jgi:site-specific DNA-methyltransferase (cytosine-N4-specific)